MEDKNDEQQIIDALMGVIKPGSSWIVRGIANDILVEPFDVTSGRKKSGFTPELETKVDSLNQRLASAGGASSIAILLGVAMVCVGIHLNWFASVLGAWNESLQSIWFYLIAVIATFFGTGELNSLWEKMVYRRYRNNLFEQIKKDGLTPSQVYVHIKDVEDLHHIASQIKEDDSLLSDVPFPG